MDGRKEESFQATMKQEGSREKKNSEASKKVRF